MIMRSTNSPFRSNFYLWNGVSAIFFSNCITNTHSHNTLQIIIDIHDRFRCRIDHQPLPTLHPRNAPHFSVIPSISSNRAMIPHP